MFELQQIVEDEWFTVGCFDSLDEARMELATVKADPYYARFTWRLFSGLCPN